MGHRDLLVTRTYLRQTPNARVCPREASAGRLSSSRFFVHNAVFGHNTVYPPPRKRNRLKLARTDRRSCFRSMSASRLVPEAKRLGICSLAADLEGTGVLVPIAIRQFRFRLAPNPKLVDPLL